MVIHFHIGFNGPIMTPIKHIYYHLTLAQSLKW